MPRGLRADRRRQRLDATARASSPPRSARTSCTSRAAASAPPASRGWPRPRADVVCFMDCDASFDPRELPRVAEPVAAGAADLVLGARAPHAGAWPLHARARQPRADAWSCGGAPASRCATSARCGPHRREALLGLGLLDRRFGWPLEMVVRAAGGGLAHRRGGCDLPPPRRALEGDRDGPGHAAHGARHGGGARVIATLIVLAKAPAPGRVKTRLSPPLSPEQAAALARAALEDTLAAWPARAWPSGSWWRSTASRTAGSQRVRGDRPARRGAGGAPRGGVRGRRRSGAPGRHGHAAGRAPAARRRPGAAGRRRRRGVRPRDGRRLLDDRARATRRARVRRRADEHARHRRGAARAAHARSGSRPITCRPCATSTRSRTRGPSPRSPPAAASRRPCARTAPPTPRTGRR